MLNVQTFFTHFKNLPLMLSKKLSKILLTIIILTLYTYTLSILTILYFLKGLNQ